MHQNRLAVHDRFDQADVHPDHRFKDLLLEIVAYRSEHLTTDFSPLVKKGCDNSSVREEGIEAFPHGLDG